MSELRALTAAVRELRERREPFVSATVLAVNGSGYRKTGARMIATQDQWRAGSISGGCLERDVTNKGLWYTRNQRFYTITYDSTEDPEENDASTGCQGVVEVLVERHEPDQIQVADVYLAAERCIRDETCAVVSTVIRASAELPLGVRMILQGGERYVEHEALSSFADEASKALATLAPAHIVTRGSLAVLVECLLPPVHLFVFGTGHDAVPLVAQAKSLGWSVSVWDASPRSSARANFQLADHYLTGSMEEAVARAERCVRSAAVVMGHHFARDRAAVELLAASRTQYIGVLGAKKRAELLLEGIDAARVHAPVGLSLGADTPAEVALAIVAEVQRTFARPKPHVELL